MPFFGRARERQIAEDVIRASGGAGCLFLGADGIGKTALARAIAEDHGAVVVAASPLERLWPYSGLSAFASGLGGRRRAAVDTVLARGRDWPEHLLAEELSRTLHLVHDEPDVVVIDDLDRMDGASITVLSYVFGRLRGTGLSVVATGTSTTNGMTSPACDAHGSSGCPSRNRSTSLAPCSIGGGTRDPAHGGGGDGRRSRNPRARARDSVRGER